MKKKLFLYASFILFMFSCAQKDSSSDQEELNSPEEKEELNEVDNMIQRDKERLDSMKKALEKQMNESEEL